PVTALALAAGPPGVAAGEPGAAVDAAGGVPLRNTSAREARPTERALVALVNAVSDALQAADPAMALAFDVSVNWSLRAAVQVPGRSLGAMSAAWVTWLAFLGSNAWAGELLPPQPRSIGTTSSAREPMTDARKRRGIVSECNDEQGTGNREQGTGSREQGTAGASAARVGATPGAAAVLTRRRVPAEEGTFWS